jgi:hypothetical protein
MNAKESSQTERMVISRLASRTHILGSIASLRDHALIWVKWGDRFRKTVQMPPRITKKDSRPAEWGTGSNCTAAISFRLRQFGVNQVDFGMSDAKSAIARFGRRLAC